MADLDLTDSFQFSLTDPICLDDYDLDDSQEYLDPRDLKAAKCPDTHSFIDSQPDPKDCSRAFQRSREYGTADVDAFRRATIAGDIDQARCILHRWEVKPASERCDVDEFSCCYDEAIEADQVEIAALLALYTSRILVYRLKHAVEKRRLAFLQLFLDDGCDINEPIGSWAPPVLSLALQDEELLRWLLDHGADPNAATHWDVTPLSWAVHKAPVPIIKLLFERGGHESIEHGTLLYWAVVRDLPDRLEVLKYVLDNGGQGMINDYEYRNRRDLFEHQSWILGNMTPLHRAIEHGNLDVVELLVSRGADPSMKVPKTLVKSSKEMDATALAEERGQWRIAEYLKSLPQRALPEAHY